MYRKTFMIIFSFFFVAAIIAQEPVKRELASFSELEVGDRIIVRLVKSDKESAVIQAQGISTSSVKTNITGNKLDITIYGEPFTKKKVIITLNFVKLTSIAVTGGADVSTSSLFKADSLFVDLKSGGMLYLDADIEHLAGKVAEGAILSAEGYATNQDMLVASSATLSAFDLESEIIRIKAITGGKAKINVEKELDAEASSKGFISYKGNPVEINRIVNSGGSINAYKP
jgi:hypothetical protein